MFGKSEKEALDRLEMVFSRLREHNLKLAKKKCYFLRESVKFLGHIVTAEGIATDPSKVSAINQVTAADLMANDGETPSPTKIRSFLGMANYYSHFIEGLSGMAKPLFALTAGQKKKRKEKMEILELAIHVGQLMVFQMIQILIHIFLNQET